MTLAAVWRRRISFDVALLSVTSAAALAIIYVVYVARGTIWRIYLAYAVVEVIIIAAWGWVNTYRGVGENTK